MYIPLMSVRAKCFGNKVVFLLEQPYVGNQFLGGVQTLAIGICSKYSSVEWQRESVVISKKIIVLPPKDILLLMGG